MTTTAVDFPRDRHVRRTGEDYQYAFLTLFPQGQAWPREPDATWIKACNGLATYWGFVDGRAADLLERESDPRETVELLPDWERAWGLPDPCFPDAITIEERQDMLVLKMTLKGAQSRAFFEQIQAWVGVEIHIVERSPFMAGWSHVGDTRNMYDDTGRYRWQIGPPELRFYWSASAADAQLIWFRCGGGGSANNWKGGQAGVDPHLRIKVKPDLECLLQRWKPAHTALVYDYSSTTNDPMAGTP
jgi:uncharacterized protein YmfQ (DUF2313 family)